MNTNNNNINIKDVYHVYSCRPIDTNWIFYDSIDDIEQKIQDNPDHDLLICSLREDLKKILDAVGHTTEDKFREGCEPKVWWHPYPQEFTILPGFIWKYHNNGVTIIASQIELDTEILGDSYSELFPSHHLA